MNSVNNVTCYITYNIVNNTSGETKVKSAAELKG